MSKLSLSKLLKDVPGRAPQPRNGSDTASRDPIPAAEASPLSGWTDGSPAAASSPAPADQAQPEPADFFFDDAAPVLSELYDEIVGVGDAGGSDRDEDEPPDVAAAGSEGEEDCEGWEVDEEDEIEDQQAVKSDGDGEIIDLCDSEAEEGQDPVAAPAAAEEEREAECRACHVCGTDLTPMHYLQQVQHVKACVSRRGLRDGSGGGAPRPPQQQQAPPQQPIGTSGRRVLDMDIRDWLKDLGLEMHVETFIAEEIDVSLVHSLTEEDLKLLGVTDLLSQRRLLAAARRVGAEMAEAKKAKRAAAKRAASTAAVPPRAKKQQTLRLPGLPALAAAPAAPAPGARSAEHQLLSRLYPPRNGTSDAQLAEEGAEPGPTPPLPPTTALPAARVSPGSTLFACASRYEPVADTLEERLEKRRAEQPGAIEQPLGRGGVTFAQPQESTATKLLKLKALRDELRCHEETVAELRRMIAELEAEVGPGAAGGAAAAPSPS